MLEDALLLDADGSPLAQKHRPHSSDWDEVNAFCAQVYMPYRTRPLVRSRAPDATMYSVETGGIVATRFSYGVPVHLSDFDPTVGRVLVLTTLRGGIEHAAGRGESLFTRAGESFVADCSRTDYWLKASEDHLQLNLTIAHDMLAQTAQHWFGFLPNDALWTMKVRFGDRDSSWIALMDYVARTVGRTACAPTRARIHARIGETVCIELLHHWAEGAGIALDRGSACAAPFYVRRAEEFMRENAAALPTMVDVASAAGVSVRALSGAFRRYRDTTPSAFLREQRLLGTRADLLAAGPGMTVGAIASLWGYVNFSEFARSYLWRFNELPSATLARAHHSLKTAAS
ncbi:helix-turn-helix domain-containing protein [Gluconacetobacter sacchari]|uniref:AraC family transcriptional regulator n=2 Tax=Gluconacetobacter sacchari TaxID=92759 RepID=A0A7W4NQ58_9PROT|nr:helix-turn-helix domain-containing protein [Gluconacetobacter sacchari]MBB2162221.1 AraC family transcriptional regulator [Gluconacetobacter sacchari]GBQ30229.1 AraC family transcriptional regulator [Gluconacetobacter sacchari DSM 12717]